MHIEVKKINFSKAAIFIKITFYLILTIFLIFTIVLILYFYTNKKSNNSKDVYSSNVYNQNLNSENNSNNEKKNSHLISYNLYKNIDAFLTIPILNIYNAPISEGTSQKIMQNYIGHFENTSYTVGNIGLASHNRGDGATYFKDLYKLKYGDYILYTYKDVLKKYVVEKIEVIDSYDWSYLENTIENKLTLITCVDDKPNFRLCVQAHQI